MDWHTEEGKHNNLIRKSFPTLSLTLRGGRGEDLFKPYRVIYRVLGNVVHVFLIADGRRDMQTLLQRRLLDS